MLTLTKVNDKLQVVLGGAITTNQLDIDVEYDVGTGPQAASQSVQTVTNGAAPVTVINASQKTSIRNLSIYNKDTVSQTVTVQKVSGATTTVLKKVTLLTGESLEYGALGWVSADANGAQKNSSVAATSGATSTADSKGVSAATQASTADSKGVSAGTQASTADSKGVSAGTQGSSASSQAASAGTAASTADSKGVSAATAGATSSSLLSLYSATISKVKSSFGF